MSSCQCENGEVSGVLLNQRFYNKSLKDWSLGKQSILFSLNLNVFSGHKINCFPRET